MHSVMIAALMLASPGAPDDAFCDTLKRVIAATPGDFEALSPREPNAGGVTLDADVSLPYYVAKLPEASIVMSYNTILQIGLQGPDRGPFFYLSIRVFPPKK